MDRDELVAYIADRMWISGIGNKKGGRIFADDLVNQLQEAGLLTLPGTEAQAEVTLRSTDGRYARVEVGPFSFTPNEARDFAHEIASQASYAERLPSIHERHVDLLASCALCRAEAGDQTDRLTGEEE